MANMSYVQFENTLADLQDCEFTLGESGLDSLSESEREKAKRLIECCRGIASEFGHLADEEDGK